MVLSVIICTFNYVSSLHPLLDALAHQTSVPFSWEVIIVDNHPSRENERAWRALNSQTPFTLRYVQESKPGLHHARHCGGRAANGEFVAYLDDDTLPCPTWISAASHLLAGDAAVLGGKVLPLWQAQPPEWVDIFWNTCPNGRFLAPLSLIELGDRVLDGIHPFLIFGCNLFISKKLLFDLNGFHPDGMPDHLLRFRGDGENALMVKLVEAREATRYDPLATVHHVVPKQRTTYDYFKHRHYIQGISDSFTDVRRHGGMSDSQPDLRTNNPMPESLSPVWDMMKDAYNMGWHFHRHELMQDESLLAFVLRDSFL